MRFSVFAVLTVLFTASSAAAQTEGRVSVGASVTLNATTDHEVGSRVSAGPLVRLNPRRGWGVAGALNWLSVDLLDPAGGNGDFAHLNARPLMGGVSYTIGGRTLLASFSLVAGPSFNEVDFEGDYVPAPGESIDADIVSLAVRPGVGVTWTLAPRVAIVGFGGYVMNRPDVRYRTSAGEEIRERWNASAVVLSVGAVYSIF